MSRRTFVELAVLTAFVIAFVVGGCTHTFTIDPQDRKRIEAHTKAMEGVNLRLWGIENQLKIVNNNANGLQSDLRRVDESLTQLKDELGPLRKMFQPLLPPRKQK